jgi:hypothetical protein
MAPGSQAHHVPRIRISPRDSLRLRTGRRPSGEALDGPPMPGGFLAPHCVNAIRKGGSYGRRFQFAGTPLLTKTGNPQSTYSVRLTLPSPSLSALEIHSACALIPVSQVTS